MAAWTGLHGMGARAADLTVLQVAPLTGVDGGLGYHLQVGAQVAFEEANALAPLPAGNLRLVTLDEQRGRVVAQVQDALLSVKPVALFGLVGRQALQSLSAGNWLARWQLPLVGLHSGSVEALTPMPPGVFVMRGSFLDEVDSVFLHLATIASRRVALVTTDDEDGREVAALVRQKARESGVQLVSSHVHPHGSALTDEAVDAVLRQPHDAVILASNTAAVANYARRYGQGGGKGQLIALSSAEATQLAAVVGPEVARGVLISQLVPHPRDPKLPLMRQWLAAYRRHGPSDLAPTLAMTEAYISARVLIETLRRCGPQPTGTLLWKALAAQTEPLVLAGLPVSLNRRGQPYRSLSMIGQAGGLVF
ncbi:ABC transporter substrate-binding protein [Ideonella sp.]|uniref:ABC transporter substrate-binding protein n=1 Tax=Ideonella sp. TaxID=1929293 RepID=UPI003BB6725D